MPGENAGAARPAPDGAARLRVFAFTIRASAEAQTLPRLLAPFAKRGVVPRRFSARSGQAPGWLSIWVEADLHDAQTAQALAGQLRAVTLVDAVVLEEVLPAHTHPARAFGAFAAG